MPSLAERTKPRSSRTPAREPGLAAKVDSSIQLEGRTDEQRTARNTIKIQNTIIRSRVAGYLSSVWSRRNEERNGLEINASICATPMKERLASRGESARDRCANTQTDCCSCIEHTANKTHPSRRI